MFNNLHSRAKDDKGFTLIELLVVILIIGILAAIAIPSFLNQRVKGQDACAKSMARTMQTAMETYYTDNNSYLNATSTVLNNYENQIPGPSGPAPCGGASAVSVGLATSTTATNNGCTGAATADGYCVGSSSPSGNAFAIGRASDGTITRVCAIKTGETSPYGGCVGGTW